MVVTMSGETFGDWFGGLLERRGLSQEKAARKLGDVSKNTVGLWTLGQGLPSYPNLVAIVRTFGELPPELADALDGCDAAA